MMNANEITFGVEIETVAPVSAVNNDGLRIGSYHHGLQVPYLPQGWRAERDGSIDASRGGYACEIVSPVLRGEEGIRQVIEAVKVLEAKGHTVNVSCGVHVHVGWSYELPAEDLARLVTIVSYAEKGLYAITGTKNRERGHYCGGVRKYGNVKDGKENLDRNRYHALNLTNLANHTQPTVEFRVFSGSLNAVKIAGWIQVCLGLVQRALSGKRCPRWEPTPLKGGWARNGQGVGEAERLMGFLAWSAGYAADHNGTSYGWLNVLELDAVKAEFRRLAAKYDAAA